MFVQISKEVILANKWRKKPYENICSLLYNNIHWLLWLQDILRRNCTTWQVKLSVWTKITMELYWSLLELVLVCVSVVVKHTMYQCKVDVDMLNAVKSVLADLWSISPSSEQRGLTVETSATVFSISTSTWLCWYLYVKLMSSIWCHFSTKRFVAIS